ncbi:MAG: epoxyqueuosine reductase [Candidatus Methanoperedenaceae archaeon]|nr:MAG: epoxyqueuosine reductase [Candidatus Methanoperedenaceae archaeon]
MKNETMKNEIRRFAKEKNAFLGFAPVDRWDDYNEVPVAFRPKSIWKDTETVIVLGLPVLLPMLETTPSIIYTTLYETCNTELDQIAFELCRKLNTKGYSSIFMPRDGYGHISVLVDEPAASFSQVYAAKYAGFGTVGYNHTLLTPQYGPRMRFVSVLTSLKIPGSKLLEKQLCTRCLICAKSCPTDAFEINKNSMIGSMNKRNCAEYHTKLREAYRFPCGVCIKVCPVGLDRKLYKSENISRYISQGSENQEQMSWKHCQKYGSKP